MAVVVITGCSSGFGMLAALEFARRGDSVYATMRNTAKADRLLAAAAGAPVEVLQLDVNDITSVGAAIEEVVLPFAAVFEVKEGLITAIRNYGDNMSLFEQLGLIPTTPA
jgi:NAD(P)-dependent dehydrogenase (short-subunit alcohol dehydrogenase family)